MTFQKTRFTPKKPVRSFRDLEVYQKALECSVMVVKKLLPLLEDMGKGRKEQEQREKTQYREGEVQQRATSAWRCPIKDKMVACALELPKMIAEAHSTRFDAKKTGLEILDDAIRNHNIMLVYLEQVGKIYSEEIDRVVVEELIRRYAWNRRKTFNLYKSWERTLDKKKE